MRRGVAGHAASARGVGEQCVWWHHVPFPASTFRRVAVTALRPAFCLSLEGWTVSCWAMPVGT